MFISVNGQGLTVETGPSKLAEGQFKTRDRGQASRETERADLRVVIKELAKPSLLMNLVKGFPSPALAVHVLPQSRNLLLPLVMSVARKYLTRVTLAHLLTSVPAGLAVQNRQVVTMEIPQVDHLAWGSLYMICPRGVFSYRQSSPCWKPGWRV